MPLFPCMGNLFWKEKVLLMSQLVFESLPRLAAAMQRLNYFSS